MEGRYRGQGRQAANRQATCIYYLLSTRYIPHKEGTALGDGSYGRLKIDGRKEWRDSSLPFMVG